jgi:hypothetical protein
MKINNLDAIEHLNPFLKAINHSLAFTMLGNKTERLYFLRKIWVQRTRGRYPNGTYLNG